MSTKARIRSLVLAPVCAGALAVGAVGGLAVPSATAATTVATVRAGITITPSSAAPNTTITIVATAKNITNKTLPLVSMGVDVPTGVHGTNVGGTFGCHPRNIGRLIYCGVSNLPAGATAQLTFQVIPTATGSYPFRSYARETYQTNDTFAYATLTIS